MNINLSIQSRPKALYDSVNATKYLIIMQEQAKGGKILLLLYFQKSLILKYSLMPTKITPKIFYINIHLSVHRRVSVYVIWYLK